MDKSLKLTWTLGILFLGSAFALYNLALLLQEKTTVLKDKNQYYEHIIKGLKSTHFPEQLISLSQTPPTQNIEKILMQQAEIQSISVEKIILHSEQKNIKTIELTLKAELDTDIFHYLNHLFQGQKNSLALREVGLFRSKNNVIGKIIFTAFDPQEIRKEGEEKNE